MKKGNLPDLLLSTPLNVWLNAGWLAVVTAILCKTFVAGII